MHSARMDIMLVSGGAGQGRGGVMDQGAGLFCWGFVRGEASSYFMYCSRGALSPPTSMRPLTKTVGVLEMFKASPSARFASTAFFASGEDMHSLKACASSPAFEANAVSLSQTFSGEIKS